MPKGKRNPKASRGGANVGSPLRKRTNKSQGASDSLTCNGIQCEMGIETLRRYWKNPNDGMKESTSMPVVLRLQITNNDQLENADGKQLSPDASNEGENSSVNSIDGYEDQSVSKRNSSSTDDIHVKVEPEDGNIAVDSSHATDIDKDSASATNLAVDSQVKTEQHDADEGSGSSPGIFIINHGLSTAVTAPPALHWIIPKALKAVSDLVNQNVLSVDGDIQASITLAGPDYGSVAVVGQDGTVTNPRSTEPIDNTKIPKTVTGNEQCSDKDIISGFVNVVKTELLTCGDCVDVFTNPLEYEKHCASHNKREPYKCLYCSERFNEKHELSVHMNDHSEKSFLCDKCQKSFSYYEKFIAHCKSHDQGSVIEPTKEAEMVKGESLQVFVCRQCDKKFRDADSLKHHEFTHSEGELFPCDQCGKTFRDEDHLMTHLKHHLKRQTCDLCGKVFTNIFDFNEHYITHKHGLKMYQCVVCQIACDNILSLRKHAASHGLKVRWCGDCGGSGHIEFSDDVQHSEDVICIDEELFTLDDVSAEDKHPEESASACEEDPLRLDDIQGHILSSELEELEVEVKVDDVLMEDEIIIDSDSNGEGDIMTDVDTKEDAQEAVRSKKRKHPGKTKEIVHDVRPQKMTNTRPKRGKQQPRNCEPTPVRKAQASKTTKKKDDESQLEVRLELRERSKRRKSNGRGQESVLLAT